MKFPFSGLASFFMCSTLCVVGCNIFNPSGTTETSKDADALIDYAQKQFRASQYGEAASLFAQALAKDSTKSEAYFGLAKSQMRAEGANPFDLLNIITSADSNEIPFVSSPLSEKNTYYRAMAAVEKALNPLVYRDSLTELWEYAVQIDTDPTVEATLGDSLKSSVKTFRLSFKKSEGYIYPATGEKFPVSDRKYKYDRFRADYALANFADLLLSVMDLNGDGYINDQDPQIGLKVDENGEVHVDVAAVVDAATTDPVVAENLNDKVDALANGTASVADLINNIGLGSAIEGSTDQATQEELTKQIDQIGDAIRFYKIGDRRDNDGDGCIDEEVLDSVDNDDDGFIDEDLRLIPDPILKPGIDGIDNDGDGLVDSYDTDEYWNGAPPAATENRKRLLPFIESLPINIPDSTGNKLTRNSNITENKLKVVRDKSGSEYPLETRKTMIGGCWRYYTQASFAAYIALHNEE